MRAVTTSSTREVTMDLEAARCDVAVIGGGIVGMATAMALAEALGRRGRRCSRPRTASPRTRPATTAASSTRASTTSPARSRPRNCVAGREALYRFCAEHGIAHERCGKVVVATHERELPRLEELERRGRANGLQGLRRLGPEQIREREPHARGVAGLFVPETGIVDYTAVTEAYARPRARRRRPRRDRRAAARLPARRSPAAPRDLVLETARGALRCRALVNCAGLHCDRVARLCGVDPRVRIVPFRGEYYELVPERQHLVRHLIYPVPDPALPVPRRALHPHGAGRRRGRARTRCWRWRARATRAPASRCATPPTCSASAASGAWACRHWRMGLAESWRSTSTGAFVAALRRLVPEIARADVRRAGAGVRAQALEPGGRLSDDFLIVEAERMIHVLNAPSPAATASITIGRSIAERAIARFGLARRA